MATIEQKDDNGNIIHTKEGIVIGRGENKRVIDPDEVEKISRSFATYADLADYFGVKEQTFRDNFREIVTKGRANTKVRLRQAQLATALKGNPTMLIWLGKNILGQSDQNTDREGAEPLPWNDNDDQEPVNELPDDNNP